MNGWCKAYFKDANDMGEVEDNSVQLIIGSPSEVARNVLERQVEWRTSVFQWFIPYAFYHGMFKECYRVLKPDGVFMFNMGTSHKDYSNLFGSNRLNCLFPYVWVQNILRATDFKIKEDFIWVKRIQKPLLPARLFGGKNKAFLSYSEPFKTRIFDEYEHFFMFTKTDSYKFTAHGPLSTVIRASAPHKLAKTQDTEITPFSEPLMRMIIETFTEEDDTVLDPLAGTGTLGKVATRLGRNCILYEINRELEPTMKKKIGNALQVMT